MEDDKKYQEITPIIRHQELIKEVKQKPLDERMLVKPKSLANSINNDLQSSSKPYIFNGPLRCQKVARLNGT